MGSRAIYQVHTISIETTAALVPTALGVLYCGNFILFLGTSCIEQFFDWLLLKCIRAVFYMHNLTLYGLIMLNFSHAQIHIEGVYNHGEIYQLHIKTSLSYITIKCTFKLFPLSLLQIADLLQVPAAMQYSLKRAEELRCLPHVFNNADDDFSAQTLATNCKIKATIAQALILRLDSEFKNWRDLQVLSISGLATAIYKKAYNPCKLNFILSSKHDFLIRRGFWGGRCEVFGNLEPGDFLHSFDFAGMYASVMAQKFCFGALQIIYNASSISAPGFYHVTVSSVNMYIPLLPARNETGQVYFPNGCWSATYWWEELLFFLANGGIIKKIHFQLVFEKTDYVLRDFSEHFMRLRKQDNFSNSFYKLFINSLYGRLGMYNLGESTRILLKKEISGDSIVSESSAGGSVSIAKVESLSLLSGNTASNVAVAAAIAAKARIKLNKAMLDLEQAGGRVLYTDTDSIFASFKKKNVNVSHGEVFWDAKKAFIWEDAVFATSKGYALKNANTEVIKLRGFKPNSITFTEFKELFSSGLRLKKVQSALFKKNQKMQFLTMEKTILLNLYDKRTFLEKKTRTAPRDYFSKSSVQINEDVGPNI